MKNEMKFIDQTRDVEEAYQLHSLTSKHFVSNGDSNDNDNKKLIYSASLCWLWASEQNAPSKWRNVCMRERGQWRKDIYLK